MAQMGKSLHARIGITAFAIAVAAVLLTTLIAGCGGPASRANEVVVYSAEKDEIVQAVSAMWQKVAPDVKLRVQEAGTNEVVQRIRAEKERPLGDVVWGIGAEGMTASPELFEPYESTETKAIDPRWLAVSKGAPWQPNNVVPMVLIYNTSRFKTPGRMLMGPPSPHFADGHVKYPSPPPPRAWDDLAYPGLWGMIAYAAPDKSGSAFTQLAVMIAVFGDNDAGWKTIGEIMKNAKILQSSGKVIKGVADGEYAVGLTYENIAGLYVRSGAPMKIVYPEEGTAVTPDGNALIRGAPHPEAAKRFLDFLLSKPVQEMLAQKLSLRSVRMDVATPPGLIPIDQIKAAPGFDFRTAAAHRKEYLDKWQALLLRLNQ
jgi:iron(III) transport system substrate-binding protein